MTRQQAIITPARFRRQCAAEPPGRIRRYWLHRIMPDGSYLVTINGYYR